MSRVDEYLALIDDPSAPSLVQSHPDDEVLTRLLLHLALADGIVEADEMALLMRVRPDLSHDEIVAWAISSADETFDPNALAAIATSPDDALNALRFAARMVCLDGDIAADEVRSLEALASAMSLPAQTTSAVIDEIVARGGEITRERVAESLRNMFWRDLIPVRDDVSPELSEAVPDGLQPVCVLTHEDRQVGVLLFEGLAAVFDQGIAWVPFDQMASYTRVPVHGAAFHLHLEDGRHLSMSEKEMRDIGGLFDYLCGRAEVAPMDP
jgi:hypothetical protein